MAKYQPLDIIAIPSSAVMCAALECTCTEWLALSMAERAELTLAYMEYDSSDAKPVEIVESFSL